MPDETTYDALKKGADSLLTADLVKTFDQLAKIAMRASAEFSDASNPIPVLPRIQRAHAVVTLIIDDAMRGLNSATTSAVTYGLMAGMESASDEGENSSA